MEINTTNDFQLAEYLQNDASVIRWAECQEFIFFILFSLRVELYLFIHLLWHYPLLRTKYNIVLKLRDFHSDVL